jgi:TM2 domain-containing membrane protein YozV
MIAIILSIIFPGLGQIYLGKNARGILMILLGITPIYPLVLIWSVYDAYKLNEQGLSPVFNRREAIWAVVIGVLIIPGCFVVLIFGSLSIRDWYQENYTLEKRTLEEGKSIVAALEKYHNGMGFYPSELSDLIEGRPLRSAWYTDEWGQPYSYQLSLENRGFLLVSKGRDQTLGTDDDIVFEK